MIVYGIIRREGGNMEIELYEAIKSSGYRSYVEYLESPHWKMFKNRWHKYSFAAQEMRRLDGHETCYGCRGTNHLALHHRTYAHLGKETQYDVILLCDGCHKKMHKNTSLVLLNRTHDVLETIKRGEIRKRLERQGAYVPIRFLV